MVKLQSLLALPVVFFSVSHAFPTAENFARLAQESRSSGDHKDSADDLHSLFLKLNEKRAPVGPGPTDISGKHEFKAPNFKAGDQRGPCPGLNALANHGYISHDGVTTIASAVSAANQVFGAGMDIAALLATLATIDVGSPVSLNPKYSIGGKTPKVANALGNGLGLLRAPEGLDAGHNLVSADSSGTRNDFYVTGDASTMNLDLFKQMLAGSDDDIITLDEAFAFASKRFDHSVATNPYFYYGPLTGMCVRNGGYILPYRLLSNHSSEFSPDGQLTKSNLMSFYGVTKVNGQLVYNRGHERIPANYYRRSTDYTLVHFNIDILALVAKHPKLGSVGGNNGKVNSFAGINMDDGSAGVLNALSLTEGNNFTCFILQFAKTFTPKALSGVFSLLEAPLQLLNEAVAPIAGLGCPVFDDMKLDGKDLYTGLMNKFPGAKKSGFAF